MRAARENRMNARQVVAGHIEQQMMLEMIVDVIGRNEQSLEKARARGARVAQRIVAVRHHGMFGDVADAGNDHHPGHER